MVWKRLIIIFYIVDCSEDIPLAQDGLHCYETPTVTNVTHTDLSSQENSM